MAIIHAPNFTTRVQDQVRPENDAACRAADSSWAAWAPVSCWRRSSTWACAAGAGAGRQPVQAPADLLRRWGPTRRCGPRRISGETITTWSAMTTAAVGDGRQRRPGRGDAERQPQRRPRRLGQPHRSGASATTRDTASSRSPSTSSSPTSWPRRGSTARSPRCCSAPTATRTAASSQFYGGANGGNLADDRLAAVAPSTPCSAPRCRPGPRPSTLLTRRQSILDTSPPRSRPCEGTLGSNEKAKLDAHLNSIQAAGEQAERQHVDRQRLHEAADARGRQHASSS